LAQNHEDAVARAARLLAGALGELQRANAGDANLSREELSRSRIALEKLAQRVEQQLDEDEEQRTALAGQLGNLAGSLDRLVNHLHGLSQLMAELLERIATPAPSAAGPGPSEPDVAPPPAEPAFQPGGEGISLTIVGLPGFQALMETQKALMTLEEVAAASVERFQEGDSRIQVHLSSPISAPDLAVALGRATGHPLAVEESQPELMRLQLKVVG
jgi:hypothetical protein